MQAFVMNLKFESVCLIDKFESFIWTERYSGAGDFEIYMPFDKTVFDLAKQNYYVWIKGSNQTMIIEEVQIETDFETGLHLRLSGRSLESILDRRVVLPDPSLEGKIETNVTTGHIIEDLLNKNVIAPTETGRKINNFVFEKSADNQITDPADRYYGYSEEAGKNLYDVIVEKCSNAHLGFRVSLSNDNRFVFKLYSGTDRSYRQEKNSYVVFSPGFENLKQSSYVESDKTFKNVAITKGEGYQLLEYKNDWSKENEAEKKNESVTAVLSIANTENFAPGAEDIGLNRREVYVDAGSVQSQDPATDESNLTQSVFIAYLQLKGASEVIANPRTKTFEGQIDTNKMFTYGTDFFEGDIVQIMNEYGIGDAVRIIEIVRSEDTSGYTLYPTFRSLDANE